MTEIKTANLKDAYAGSYYTILGTGEPLSEWVEGYEKVMAGPGIGKPQQWYQTTGKKINEYTNPANPHDAFKDDLTVLMFPLDGLDVGKLAMFKMSMMDRWFDDIVDNIKTKEEML